MIVQTCRQNVAKDLQSLSGFTTLAASSYSALACIIVLMEGLGSSLLLMVN